MTNQESQRGICDKKKSRFSFSNSHYFSNLTRMGIIHKVFLDSAESNSNRIFQCCECKTHFSTHEEIISKVIHFLNSFPNLYRLFKALLVKHT